MLREEGASGTLLMGVIWLLAAGGVEVITLACGSVVHGPPETGRRRPYLPFDLIKRENMRAVAISYPCGENAYG